jgi:hypothetical protein
MPFLMGLITLILSCFITTVLVTDDVDDYTRSL